MNAKWLWQILYWIQVVLLSCWLAAAVWLMTSRAGEARGAICDSPVVALLILATVVALMPVFYVFMIRNWRRENLATLHQQSEFMQAAYAATPGSSAVLFGVVPVMIVAVAVLDGVAIFAIPPVLLLMAIPVTRSVAGHLGTDAVISRRRWFWLGLLLLVAAIALPPLIIPLYNPWLHINYHSTDINLQTGQQREIQYLWYITVEERVTETPLSLALGGERISVAPIAEWHVVYLHAPHYISMHTIFHGALADAHAFGELADLLKLDAARRRTIAREILQTWQKNGRDSGVEPIFAALRGEYNRIDSVRHSRESGNPE